MEDMRLMRSNAHEYNVGTPGIEVRLMVDTLVEYSAALVRRIMQAAVDSQQKSYIDLVYTQRAIQYFDLVDNDYSWSSAASLLEAQEPPAITEFIRSNPFTIDPIPIQAVKTEEKEKYNLSQTSQSNSFSQVLKFSLKKPAQVESSDYVEDDTQFYFGNDEDEDEDIEPFFDEFSEEEIEIIKQPPKKIKLLLSSQPTEEIEEQNDEYEDNDNNNDYDYDEYDEDGNRAEEYNDDFYNYDEYSNGGILKLKTTKTKTKASSYLSTSYLNDDDDASSNEGDYYSSKSYSKSKSSKSKSKSSRTKSSSSKRSSKYDDDYDQDDEEGENYSYSTTNTKSRSKKKGGSSSSSYYNEGDYDQYYQQQQPENSELAASGMYEWEMCCEAMLKRLGKHEYIDSKRRAADFYNPIVEQFPEIANDYLDIIK